jgi:Ca2+-binding RTX toxin-like protein
LLTLSGNVTSLSRTNNGGTRVYETLSDVLVDASAFYPDGVGVMNVLLAGNDTGTGWSGKDFLIGGTGDDTLSGGDGNNILDGGAGTDQMNGGKGDDTYVLRAGDGGPLFYVEAEYVNESAGGFDTVRIEGVAPEDVVLAADAETWQPHIALRASDGSITYTFTVGGSGPGVQGAIERIEFDDGTVWDLTGPLNLTGWDNYEVLFGSDFNDTIDGRGGGGIILSYGGDDVLRGGNGYDWMDGGDGNDVLIGGDGPSELSGGAGNDTIEGGAGDDYIYDGEGDNDLSGGDGNDSVFGSGPVFGGAGNDFVNGSGLIDGGAGGTVWVAATPMMSM